MKIKSLVFVLTLLFANISFAQNIIYSNDEDIDHGKNTEEVTNSTSPVLNKESKISTTVNLGTSISTSSFANAVSVYTAPEIKYKLSPKLNISAGFLFMNTTVSGYYFSEKEKQKNFTQGYLYTGIDYKATERLRISGEILYGLNKSPYAVYSNKQNSDYYLRFSAEYKITDNLSIGLQVINQNMSYPAYNNPFNRNPFGTPNPFDPFSRY